MAVQKFTCQAADLEKGSLSTPPSIDLSVITLDPNPITVVVTVPSTPAFSKVECTDITFGYFENSSYTSPMV